MASLRAIGLATLAMTLVGVTARPAESTAIEARYRFEPGTRIEYLVTLERSIRPAPDVPGGPSIDDRRVWRAHVVALEGGDGRAAIGIQRNLREDVLESWLEGGRDVTTERQNDYDEATARSPARFAEGNLVDALGKADGPWSAAREAGGDLVVGLHEILALPPGPIEAGTTWKGSFPLGLTHRVVSIDGPDQRWSEFGPCIDVDSDGGDQPFRMKWTWCTGQGGVVTEARFEGRWFGIGSLVTDTWSLQLIGRGWDETPVAWLESPDVRLAALEAALRAPDAAIPDDALIDVMAGEDDEAARLAGALLLRRRATVPEENLDALAGHADPRRAALVARLASRDQAAPPIEGIPDWFCSEEPGWPDRLKAGMRYPPRPPGYHYLRMEAPRHRGRPWAMYVPETYTGDRPVPLLIVLAGGHGRLTTAVRDAVGTVEDLGWLVAFPDAAGYWWHDPAPDMLDALIDEILRTYAIDTQRVAIAGFSNGGTGTLFATTWWPHRFSAGVSLMGAGAFPPEARTPDLASARNVPLLFVHGKRDETIAWQTTRDTVRRLEALPGEAGVEVRYEADRGHDLLLSTDDGRTLDFVARHRRDPFPRTIRAEMRDLRFPRRFWVEVLAKSPGTATVDVRRDPEGRIDIRTRRIERLRLLLRRELLPGDGPLSVRWNGRDLPPVEVRRDCAELYRSLGATADPWLAWSLAVDFEVPR